MISKDTGLGVGAIVGIVLAIILVIGVLSSAYFRGKRNAGQRSVFGNIVKGFKVSPKKRKTSQKDNQLEPKLFRSSNNSVLPFDVPPRSPETLPNSFVEPDLYITPQRAQTESIRRSPSRNSKRLTGNFTNVIKRQTPTEMDFKENNPDSELGIKKQSSLPVQDGIRMTVIDTYESFLDDELKLNLDDVILVSEMFDDGWAVGKNLNTGEIGAFPLNCCLLNNEKINAPNKNRASSLLVDHKKLRESFMMNNI